MPRPGNTRARSSCLDEHRDTRLLHDDKDTAATNPFQPPQGRMSIAYLQNLIDQADVAFIHDTIGKRGFGMLRTLPAIHYLGTNRFTFPKSWRQLESPAQYDYLGYDYELLGEIGPPESNLCAISDQNYEEHTEFTLSPVILAYESNPSDATLVVIGDTPDFDPQEGQRPLREQPFVKHLGSAQTIYNHFEEYYESRELRCPLSDTANIFMQDNANIYRLVTGERLSHTRELFEVLPDAPYLPLYAGLASIFSRETQPGASPLDSFEELQALGKWLRRRLEWDYQRGISVARRMNNVVSENERTFDSAQITRHADVLGAQDALQKVQDKSDVHRRYAEWVMELTE